MNRAKHFRAYTLDEETETPPQPSDVALTHTADSTREDDVGMYELIRRHRGLREISEGQSRNLLQFLHQFELSISALEGPRREIRTAVTAHVEPEFLAEFKQLAAVYGVSPSNLARLVLTGWARSTDHPKASDE